MDIQPGRIISAKRYSRQSNHSMAMNSTAELNESDIGQMQETLNSINSGHVEAQEFDIKKIMSTSNGVEELLERLTGKF